MITRRNRRENLLSLLVYNPYSTLPDSKSLSRPALVNTRFRFDVRAPRNFGLVAQSNLREISTLFTRAWKARPARFLFFFFPSNRQSDGGIACVFFYRMKLYPSRGKVFRLTGIRGSGIFVTNYAPLFDLRRVESNGKEAGHLFRYLFSNI